MTMIDEYMLINMMMVTKNVWPRAAFHVGRPHARVSFAPRRRVRDQWPPSYNFDRINVRAGRP